MTERILSRRTLLQLGAGAGAGLVLGLVLPGAACRAPEQEAGVEFHPNAWLSVAPDGTVTILVGKSEMGQGVWTALPMIVAEELDAAWGKVRVRHAPSTAEDSYQNTGGSASISESWDLLRRAGAAARQMLITAAAARWRVPPQECVTLAGRVSHPASRRTVRYGDLAPDAARLPVPDEASVPLKRREDYRLIGRPVGRLDAPAKTRGEAVYGIDVRVPGMKFAVVARCPSFAGALRHVDASRALASSGVRQVVRIDPVPAPTHLRGGVAVVADSTWQALEGRRQLALEWDRGPHGSWSTQAGRESFRAGLAGRASVIRDEGRRPNRAASRIVEATYEYPFLAHATMEPGNATVAVRADTVEIWAPTQYPARTIRTVGQALGVAPDRITLHVTFLGGGFGRRINDDFVIEAALVSRQAGLPVQVVWTRDDDLQHDFYRQAGVQRLRAELDARGLPASLVHRIVGPSTNAFYWPGHPRPAEQELWGVGLPYAISHRRIEYVQADTPVPIGWWRSVSVSQNQFCIEAFLSEVAERVGRDPLDLRRDLLRSEPRLRGVLEAVAELSDWYSAPPPGRARGVALTEHVAEVVEAGLLPDGSPRVYRVWCAIDCGLVINPGIVRAQAEGSIIWGLTAALMNEITVAAGAPEQRSFADYPLMRMRDVPEIHVRIVESPEPPSGIGEPCVVPVAPALAAAVGRLRGTPVRALPIRGSGPARDAPAS